MTALTDGEQYRGWNALPPAMPMDAGITTIDSAIAELHRWVPDMAWDFDDPDAVNRAFRAAAKFVHPDAGGDATAFRRLSAARDLLIGPS